IAGTQMNMLDDYINVKNGLLNWKTGELREHTPDRRSTIQFPVLYDPTANDPAMLQFIESVLEQDTHATLFEMIGYFLIPTLEYEKIFLFTGTGSNGKSVLIKTIEAMIGKANISKVKIQDLEGDRSRFKIAELYGKVLNCFTDIPADALNSTGNLKVLASGEGLNAEKKGKDPFNFEPFCKLLFSANELPKSSDHSDGFFRRLTVFPFTRKFTDQQKDTKLIHKLTTPSALSTLLNYALEGLRRLEQQGGFSYSQTITDQVKTYQMESDTIMLFIDEECEIESEGSKQGGSRIECKRLYVMYSAWCKQGGFKPEKVTQFNKHLDAKLKDKIYRKKAKTISGNSVPCWFGIKI
ncbi:DNA primase family protein, partial [Paenibacillus sp. NRS-1781]|uniref:DNA primase family protein n=1 Tax=Paenibacillus sp. NRS-1781 TaxID=3233905 RepID=UPI003D2CFB05